MLLMTQDIQIHEDRAPLSTSHCTTVCFGLKKRKFRIIFIVRIEGAFIFSLDWSHGKFQVTCKHLGFAEKEEIWEVLGGEMNEIEDISSEALNIPSHGGKRS